MKINIRGIMIIHIKDIDDLKKNHLYEIQIEIILLKDFLDFLNEQKVKLQQEIKLHKEDLEDLIESKEELQKIEADIEKVSNYLDRLIDFESFAE